MTAMDDRIAVATTQIVTRPPTGTGSAITAAVGD